MRFMVLFIVVSLMGCATQQSLTPPFVSMPPQQQADVLILSPQGVDPDSDTVGFNTLVKNVNQSFAEEFSFLLAEKNVSNVSVIDQRPNFDAGEKMALYGVYFDTKIVVMLEIITETVNSDERLMLRADYIEIDQLHEEGKVTGVKPTLVLTRSYLLRSSLSGDSPKTTMDLAYEFMAYLQTQGKFN